MPLNQTEICGKIYNIAQNGAGKNLAAQNGADYGALADSSSKYLEI